MVYQAVDDGRGGHRVLEDPVPLAEHQVAGDQGGSTFVALGQEGEQNFHLLGALLHVPDVIEDDQCKPVQLAQGTGQLELTLGNQQCLHQLERRGEQDGVAGLDQDLAECTGGVRLAGSRQAEGQDVDGALEEVTSASSRS